MLLVDFSGVQVDVDGMDGYDRGDLEKADKLMKKIESRHLRWLHFFEVVVGVAFITGCLSADLDSFWLTAVSYGMLGTIPASIGALIVARWSGNNTLEDVVAIEDLFREKKDKPCVALIRERVIRSPVLAFRLERAFANDEFANAPAP